MLSISGNSSAIRGYCAILSGYMRGKELQQGPTSELPQITVADQEERAMQRNDEHRDDDLIDMGSLAQQTKGQQDGINDFENGRQLALGGLSDD